MCIEQNNVEEREEFRLGRYDIHSTRKKLCTTHAGGGQRDKMMMRNRECVYFSFDKTVSLEILQ